MEPFIFICDCTYVHAYCSFTCTDRCILKHGLYNSHQASKRTYVLVKLLKMLSRSVYIYCHFISKNGAIRLKIEDGIDVYRDNLQITIIDPHKNLLYKIDILFPSSIRCTPATESTNCVLNPDLHIFQLHEQCKWNISHMFGLNIFCVWY